MAYHNIPFPRKISWGSRGGPGFRTHIPQTESGVEHRVARWSTPLHRYNVAYGIKSYDDLSEVLAFYRARSGALHSFPFQDPLDFHSNPVNPTWEDPPGSMDQNIGTGDNATTSFQLRKTYTSGPSSSVRKITKPVQGTVQIWVAGVLKTETTDYSVNYATGVVLMNSAPTAGQAVQASFQFDVPVRFGSEADEQLSVNAETFGDGGVEDITLVEDRDGGAGLPEEYLCGGSKEISSAVSFSVSSLLARVWIVQMTTTSKSVILEDPLNVPDGSELFRIVNGGSNSFTVKDHLAITLVTLAANQGCEILLSKNAGGKVWYAV